MSQVFLLPVLLGLLFSQGLTASVLDTVLESWKNFSEQCQKTMARDPPSTGLICSRMYDNYSCWPDTPADTTANVSCPWYLPWYNKVKDGYVFKNCSPDGQWVLDSDGNPWRDSSQCEQDAMDKLNEEAFMKVYLILRIMQIVGYSLSLAALFLALLILIGFRKLHCMRNYIHMNLFASFILRAVSVLITDAAINMHHKINDHNIQEMLQKKVSIGCRVAMVLMQYSVVASYYWLLVEGLYLLNLLVIAVFSEKSYFNIYLCIGWGTPVLVVVPWVVVKYLYENSQCWSNNDNMAYWWIIRAPILLVILINFFIFLRIIQILVSKLKAHQMRYTDYKFRLAKSTLTLIPLLGIHEIVTVFVFDETAKGMVRHAKLFFELFLSSFQGLLVAILYCFVNKEVQSELLKKWKRWKLGKDIEEEYKHTHSQTPHVKVEGAGCEKLNLISNCNNGTGKTRHTLQDGTHTCENIGTSTTEQITLSERTHCYGFPQEIAESTF